MPILALPVEGTNILVEWDASHSCLDVVLMQDKNIIDYSSHQLKVHDRNYLAILPLWCELKSVY